MKLAQGDLDGFVSLDAYLRDCLEEWTFSDGQLSAHSIALLNGCARSITKRFQLLDSEGHYYFGQFMRLARRILHGVDVGLAYQQGEQEMNKNLNWEQDFGDHFLISHYQ